MAKEKPKKVRDVKPLPECEAIVLAEKTFAMDKPEPAKAKRDRLTNAKLKALAKKRKPPQSWYEEDLDRIADGDFSRF